ncbi:MAG: tyrosine-type recombinase/integrase [Candidatus Sulfotelmatobacter sp.]
METKPKPTPNVPIVSALVEQYKAEKLPERLNTKRTYLVWLKHYILPKWGECKLSEIQARTVELWIGSLDLAPKSKGHVRGMLRLLWEYAMWSGSIPLQRNPMELVTIKGVTKRLRKPRSLTVAEFQKFITHLGEPFRTIALLSVCFGLRISEALALKWGDVDWLNQTLSIERRIVSQHIDSTKTDESQRKMAVDPAILGVLKAWKQRSQFADANDWIFASPSSLGRLPWSYAQVWDYYSYASRDAGIGHVSTHVLRHTYRSWLDAAGTQITVQQRLMRHADIRTTLNIYGDVVTDEMSQAHSKVVGFALNGMDTACKPS